MLQLVTLATLAAPQRAAMLSCLLPGLEQQVRCKVYTSNIMGEERSKRISDHMTYMKAKKAYRLNLHQLVTGWKHELRQKALEDQALEQRKMVAAAKQEAEDLRQRLQEKRLSGLGEQLKQAELELKVAHVRLRRAQRQEEVLKREDQAALNRYERLLEASRNWIREEEFEAAIHKALDSPEPFGFITNLEVRKGF